MWTTEQLLRDAVGGRVGERFRGLDEVDLLTPDQLRDGAAQVLARPQKAEFIPGAYHQSWNGVFHGGLLALCLDEAFGYVLYFQGIKGMTAKMEMRIRQTIRTGQKIRITGEVKRKTRKLVETYAKAELEDGTLAAEATASMYVTTQEFL